MKTVCRLAPEPPCPTTAAGRAVRRHAGNAQAGLMLVECLVYLSCVFAVLGVATAVFLDVLQFSRDLRRNADDIIRVIKAGERWRADVRAATGPLALEQDGAVLTLHIPQSDGRVSYRFVTNAVLRTAEKVGRTELVLPAARACVFTLEPRQQVTSWRWEIALPSRLKAVRVSPLFAFTAVSSPETPP